MTTPDYKIIGKRIKEARKNANLTQVKVSDELDISVAFYSRIETGRSKVNLTRLIEIASVLKVEPSFLLNGCNLESKQYLRQEFQDILDKCTPEKQKFIYQIAELVLNFNQEKEQENIKNKKTNQKRK